MVFDHAGQRLYIATAEGLVWPYNLSTNSFGAPYDLGGWLNAVDIAADDSFLLIAQQNSGVTQGAVQKLNLATGAVTNINYARESGEGGAFDVAIGSNGLAMVTTDYEGSGWTPLREINLATNVISVRSDVPGYNGSEVTGSTQIYRSAHGTHFYFLEGNISSGPVFTYSATTNTFGPSAETELFSRFAAMNRNGTLVATILFSNGGSLDTSPNFNYVHNFTGADSGLAFDAMTDTLYVVNTSAHRIIAYGTNTFAEKFRLNISKPI